MYYDTLGASHYRIILNFQEFSRRMVYTKEWKHTSLDYLLFQYIQQNCSHQQDPYYTLQYLCESHPISPLHVGGNTHWLPREKPYMVSCTLGEVIRSAIALRITSPIVQDSRVAQHNCKAQEVFRGYANATTLLRANLSPKFCYN